MADVGSLGCAARLCEIGWGREVIEVPGAFIRRLSSVKDLAVDDRLGPATYDESTGDGVLFTVTPGMELRND